MLKCLKSLGSARLREAFNSNYISNLHQREHFVIGCAHGMIIKYMVRTQAATVHGWHETLVQLHRGTLQAMIILHTN